MRTFLILVALYSLAGCKKETPAEPAKPEARAEVKPEAAKPAGVRTVAMEVTADGFVPARVNLKAGEPVKLLVTRKTDETCATALQVEGTDIKVDLPLNKQVEVAWTPPKAGNVKFGCTMDFMVSGVLIVE